MSTQNRRSSFSSSTSSSLAKRHASSSSSSSENAGKISAVPPHMAKKRAPLSNLTNRNNVSHNGSRSSVPPSTLVLLFDSWSFFVVYGGIHTKENCTIAVCLEPLFLPIFLMGLSLICKIFKNVSGFIRVFQIWGH